MPIPGIPQRYHDSDRVRATATPATAHTPPADASSVRVGWRGFSVALPMSLLASLITALVTHWASPATLPPNDELRGQVREIAADLRELKHDSRDTRDQLAMEQSFTRRNIPILAAVIESGCSAKFAWQDGRRPADPGWLPMPMRSDSAKWQPAIALLPPPAE
jgi:hypothetical protein